MDIVWVGLGISVVVGFVFYVMASYWQRLLRMHTKAIRSLSQRVEGLEEREDERLMKRVEVTPQPTLKQVFIFSFRLGERFWPETMGATAEQLRCIREHGKFLASAKIERQGNRIGVALTELLPQNQSAGWQTRTIDIHVPDGSAEPAVLWEMFLESPDNAHARDATPALELRFEEESLVLWARRGRNGSRAAGFSQTSANDEILFRVPLDEVQLGEFRAGESEMGTPSEGGDVFLPVARESESPIAIYQNQDSALDVDWQLCLRDQDADRGKDSEKWSVVEPVEERRVGQR